MRGKLGPYIGIIAVAAFLSVVLCRPASAGSFEVAPTSIVLGGSETAVFYIINHSAVPIVAQVEGYAWSQDAAADNNDKFEDTADLIISPPMIRLMPNQQQTVRLMVKPNGVPTPERPFRLVVSEIPDPSAPSPTDGIRMLLQFSVPVFVRAKTAIAEKLDWSANRDGDGIKLSVRNQGLLHAKLSNISLVDADGQPVPVNGGSFRYILAGSEAEWNLPVTANSGQPVHVKAFDDIAATNIDVPLTVQ
jgi:fimbrial chaperone protein